ncbi:unnamed protein product, partial [Diabrotica balteata]
MIKKKQINRWTHPNNEQNFEDHIGKFLQEKSSTNDINILNDIIVEAITEAQKKCCPKSVKEEKISLETQKKMEQRRILRSDENSSNDDINRMNKEVSREIRKDLRKYKDEKIIKTIEENKSMKIMRRKLTNGNKQIVKLKDRNGNITSNREHLLQIVESFYETLYSNQSTLYIVEYQQRKVQNQGSEDIPEISLDEIYKALKKMKNNKAPGEDGVVTEAIKLGGSVLIAKIQKLFNLCLWNQNIPTKWNNSITVLLHKKGDIADLERYRPISLLNHLYKLYTQIITNRLETQLDFYQPREQAGFRPNYGTNDHLQCL